MHHEQFNQQVDGTVWVRSGGRHYSETLENFTADFGEAPPPLPDGALDRVYDPGRRHALHGAEGVLHGGELPWGFGDRAIAAIDGLLAAKAARETVVPTERDMLVAQIGEIEASVTPRRLREAVLTEEGRAWLGGVEAEIARLRQKTRGG